MHSEKAGTSDPACRQYYSLNTIGHSPAERDAPTNNLLSHIRDKIRDLKLINLKLYIIMS